jgi:hypothetical protein
MVALSAALVSGALIAAEPAAVEPSQPTEQVSHAIDEVLSMHAAGVDPGTIVAHLRSMPELPRLSAADIIQLQKKAVSPDVMSALVLMSVPDKTRLSADDIVELHRARVPRDVISDMIQKARKTTEVAARNAAAATPKTNQKYLLAMPRTSSTIIIPHRPYYYSPD